MVSQNMFATDALFRTRLLTSACAASRRQVSLALGLRSNRAQVFAYTPPGCARRSLSWDLFAVPPQVRHSTSRRGTPLRPRGAPSLPCVGAVGLAAGQCRQTPGTAGLVLQQRLLWVLTCERSCRARHCVYRTHAAGPHTSSTCATAQTRLLACHCGSAFIIWGTCHGGFGRMSDFRRPSSAMAG